MAKTSVVGPSVIWGFHTEYNSSISDKGTRHKLNHSNLWGYVPLVGTGMAIAKIHKMRIAREKNGLAPGMQTSFYVKCSIELIPGVGTLLAIPDTTVTVGRYVKAYQTKNNK